MSVRHSPVVADVPSVGPCVFLCYAHRSVKNTTATLPLLRSSLVTCHASTPIPCNSLPLYATARPFPEPHLHAHTARPLAEPQLCIHVQAAGEVGSGWDVSLEDLEAVLQPATFLENRQMASVPDGDVVLVEGQGAVTEGGVAEGGAMDVSEVAGAEGDVQLTWTAFYNTAMHLFNR